MDGITFSSGLRDEKFRENGAQGSKVRQENGDRRVQDIPCYDPDISTSSRAVLLNLFEEQ